MSEAIRVLIADDHEVVRDGLRMILEAEEGFSVVGEAGDGAQAVDLTGKLLPQVVLMDLRMPRMDGLEAIELIRDAWPEVAIVILTTYNEDDLMLRGLRAGALGYLLKDTNRQTLMDTLRAAARGEALLLPDVIARALSAAPSGLSASRRASVKEPKLTEREHQVLRRAAKGERSKEIAAGLGITERTVKSHLSSIYNKLGVDSRAAAVAEAAKRGLLDEGAEVRM
ncbi:MAG: response regulator transcription factor [Anaerolineales bacterium]|nr:MAG: response regulator transcription factor [Anaerolineales bacterium]